MRQASVHNRSLALKASVKTGKVISYFDGNVCCHSNHRKQDDGAGLVEGVDCATPFPANATKAGAYEPASMSTLADVTLVLTLKDDVLLLVNDNEALEQIIASIMLDRRLEARNDPGS